MPYLCCTLRVTLPAFTVSRNLGSCRVKVHPPVQALHAPETNPLLREPESAWTLQIIRLRDQRLRVKDLTMVSRDTKVQESVTVCKSAQDVQSDLEG